MRLADALGLQHQAVTDGAQILPAQSGSDGFSRGPVPHDGRGSLVGDAHGLHGPGVGQGLAGTGEGRIGHHLGVELDEAGHR